MARVELNLTDGQELAGTVVVRAVCDESPIRMRFVLDGAVIGSDRRAPFEWRWDTTGVPDGPHVVRAAARRSGRTLAYDEAKVVVKNAVAPEPTPEPEPEPEPTPEPEPEPTPALHLSGDRSDGGVTGTTSFGTWRGRRVEIVLDYIGGGTTWAHWDAPLPSYITAWRGHYPLILSVQAWPHGAPGTLEKGAAGEYDGHWANLARNLVAAGMAGDTIIRPMHECTGDWYTWTWCVAPKVRTFSPERAKLYAAYYRRIVKAMKGVAESLRFEWNTANGGSWSSPSAAQLELGYPGDDVTDYFGRDFYDRCWASADICGDGLKRWNTVIARPLALTDFAAMAERHGKQIIISEYGLVDNRAGSGHEADGGGDNVVFIEQAWRWFAEHDVYAEVYFDRTTSDMNHALRSGAFPNASKRYAALVSA